MQITTPTKSNHEYFFIRLHLEDFRCKNPIFKRIIALVKPYEGHKRLNNIRVPIIYYKELESKLNYLVSVSLRYKKCLIEGKFNYKFRAQNDKYHSPLWDAEYLPL